MTLEDLVLLKMASFFSEDDVVQAFDDARNDLSSVKLASEDAEVFATRDVIMHKLAASFEDEELHQLIAEAEYVHAELQKEAGLSELAGKALRGRVGEYAGLAVPGLMGAYSGYQSGRKGEDSSYGKSTAQGAAAGALVSGGVTAGRVLDSYDDPRLSAAVGAVGAASGGVIGGASGAAGHALGRLIGKGERKALGERVAEDYNKKESSVSLTPEQIVQLSNEIGSEKVAQLIAQVEAERESEKIAQYHYELGQVMGHGIADSLEKQAMGQQQLPGMDTGMNKLRSSVQGAAGKISGAASSAMGHVRNLAGATKDLAGLPGAMKEHYGQGQGVMQTLREAAPIAAKGAVLPAAALGAGLIARKAYKNMRGDDETKEARSGDAAVYGALATLSESGFDLSKISMKKDDDGDEDKEDRSKKHEAKESKKHEEDEKKEDMKKQSLDASVYRSLATLESSGYDTSKIAKRKLPESFKKNRFDQDEDDDGKVDEGKDDKDKASKKEKKDAKEEAEKKASLFQALAVCADNGIKFQ